METQLLLDAPVCASMLIERVAELQHIEIRRIGVALPNLPDDFDVNDPDMYADHLPRAEWEELRRTAPVWWQAQPRGRDGFPDDGHWVITRHADVKEISRKDAVFSSW